MSSPLLKPRWLTGHVLVIVLAVAFTALGFWQLSRHYQQQDDNVILERKLAADPIALTLEIGPDMALQRAVISGRYDYSAQLELRPRARNGRIGYDQIVPLVSDEGVVLVNRGFIPDAAGSARSEAQMEGEITVTGTVRIGQQPSGFGPQNPDTGHLDTISRIDLTRLAGQFDHPLLPIYLDLRSEVPEIGGLTTVLPDAPETTSRPNLPYAIQWWSFAVIVTVGWTLYLRKQFFSR